MEKRRLQRKVPSGPVSGLCAPVHQLIYLGLFTLFSLHGRTELTKEGTLLHILFLSKITYLSFFYTYSAYNVTTEGAVEK